MLFFSIILGQELHLHVLVVAIWWQNNNKVCPLLGQITVGNYFISPRSGSTVRVAGYDMLECPGIVLPLVKLLWHQVVLLLVKLLWHQVRSQRAAGTAVSNYWASKSKDCLLQNVRRASHL